MLLSDYRSNLRLLIHDLNASDFTDANLNGFINQARTRVAIDTQCVQTYLSGLNTITQQEQYPLTGFVGGINLKSGGTNYTNPAIVIDPPPVGGVQARATAVLLGGVIQNVNMVSWGGGYTSVPNVSIMDATGTGASASAIAGINIINWLQPVDILWGNLRLNFEYLTFIDFNTYCRAWASVVQGGIQSGGVLSQPGVFTVHLGNQSVFIFPIPNQPYPMAITASLVPNLLVNDTDVDNQVIAPWSDAVNLFAAHLAYASIQNLGMADFYYSGADPRKPLGKYDLRVRQLPASVTPYRIPNPYLAGRRRIRRM